MSGKQTRRCISIPGTLYEALRAQCEVRGVAMAGLTTALLARFTVASEVGEQDQALVEQVQTHHPSGWRRSAAAVVLRDLDAG